jgi:hypothetical protein
MAHAPKRKIVGMFFFPDEKAIVSLAICLIASSLAFIIKVIIIN